MILRNAWQRKDAELLYWINDFQTIAVMGHKINLVGGDRHSS